MRVAVNYHREHILQVPQLLEKAFGELEGVEVVSPLEEAEIVVNSMPWMGIVRGTKKTVYWELDIAEANHSQDYNQFDLVYYPSTIHTEIWPTHSKLLFMACDPEYYHPIETPLELDVLFMGRTDRSFRVEYVENLKQKFKADLSSAERGLPTSKALSSAKCSSQISEFENLEQRNFEYTGVVPMVLERVHDLPEVFKEEEHVRAFTRGDYAEFESQIEWCVNNYDKALEMRDRAIKHIQENHTYKHRAQQILEDVC